jgi:hypothetical protein
MDHFIKGPGLATEVFVTVSDTPTGNAVTPLLNPIANANVPDGETENDPPIGPKERFKFIDVPEKLQKSPEAMPITVPAPMSNPSPHPP